MSSQAPEVPARLLAAAFVFAALPLGADEVVLTNGNRIRGIVVERDAATVTIAVGPGRVSVPASRVAHIVEGTSDLATFRERAQGLAPGDLQGWLALGRWARERELLTQARECFERALAADPANAEAHAALDHVRHEGRWLSREEALRAQGYVEWEGRWVTPRQRAAALAERAERAAAERARAEADARVREAEARAREAEARARQAEAESLASQPAFPPYGVPLWLGGGCCAPTPAPTPIPTPAPTPRPPRQPVGGGGWVSTPPPSPPEGVGPPRRPRSRHP
jgi:hypothetical protein